MISSPDGSFFSAGGYSTKLNWTLQQITRTHTAYAKRYARRRNVKQCLRSTSVKCYLQWFFAFGRGGEGGGDLVGIPQNSNKNKTRLHTYTHTWRAPKRTASARGLKSSWWCTVTVSRILRSRMALSCTSRGSFKKRSATGILQTNKKQKKGQYCFPAGGLVSPPLPPRLNTLVIYIVPTGIKVRSPVENIYTALIRGATEQLSPPSQIEHLTWEILATKRFI